MILLSLCWIEITSFARIFSRVDKFCDRKKNGIPSRFILLTTGIRKLELERTKFGKFASQGTNNSRSWKFKFEGVLDHKIYLHERHIFFSPHFREHSSCWNYSVDFRYCSSKRALLQTTAALFLGRFFFRSASKILLYIRDRIDICRTEEKSRSNPLEGSVIRRLCLSKNSSFKTHPLKRISFPFIFLPLNRKYAYRLASKSWLTRNYSWDEQQTGRTSRD